jgi:hypothetical protein
MAYFFSIIALICPLLLSGQLVLEGYIADAKSKEPLAFVNIVINDNLNGTTSDIDGKFVLESNTEITQLRCSYVGYEARTITIKPGQNYVAISLTKTSYDLNEVVILPGVNPAHRIVDKVIENRKFNDPEKACSFAYTSYNKMIFTMDVDSAYLSQERRTAESDTDEIKRSGNDAEIYAARPQQRRSTCLQSFRIQHARIFIAGDSNAIVFIL